MMQDSTQLLNSLHLENLRLILKLGFLLVVALHGLFIFVIIAKIRSLTHVIVFQSGAGKIFIQVFSIFYLLVVLSLFVLTLVIV